MPPSFSSGIVIAPSAAGSFRAAAARLPAKGLPVGAVDRARRQRRRAALRRLLPRRKRNAVEAAERQAGPEILFVGRDFPARRRVLSEDCSQRFSDESARRRAEHGTRERAICRGQHAAGGQDSRSGAPTAPLPEVEVTVVQFTARDTTSSIERAQYSVDGGDWILVAPAGNISDAPEERYEIKLTGLAAGRTQRGRARLRSLRQRRQRQDDAPGACELNRIGV